MEITEIFVLIAMAVITAINYQMYKLIVRRYFEILRQFCDWEVQIKEWVRDELN